MKVAVLCGMGLQGKAALADLARSKDVTEIICADLEPSALGKLEAVPNGDAVFYTDLLSVTDTIQETRRYALRWPGWCAFWAPLKKLGFLSDDPVDGLGCKVSPVNSL